ncbi:MAG: hypothetical protein Q8P11_02020 [bacterium]|nr:hypothetical protein [bacterium]
MNTSASTRVSIGYVVKKEIPVGATCAGVVVGIATGDVVGAGIGIATGDGKFSCPTMVLNAIVGITFVGSGTSHASSAAQKLIDTTKK